MKVAIIGAGPAGLYLATLLKRNGITSDIRVYEQNAADSTFGFGVVFSDSALEFLRIDDHKTYDAITPGLESWRDIQVVHRGEKVVIDGVGFTALGRLRLLELLQEQARKEGIAPRFGKPVKSLDEVKDADLIVGADGVNSLVRRSDEAAFGTSISHLTNRFAWFGTTRPFEALTQTFVEHERGFFNAHHYRYAPGMSTFLAECDAATFEQSGLAEMSEHETKRLLEQVFKEALDGHELISNRSIWRQFPQVRNARYAAGNKVLLGDALHTAHFSIGSGTRLAMEDAVALARALKDSPKDIPAALSAYEFARKPILDMLLKAADKSAKWYETFTERMPLAPYDFAMSYLTRSGRIDKRKLKQMAPRFVAAYEAAKSAPSA